MKRGESLSWATTIIKRRYAKLNPNPDYQRDSVWTKDQKQLLVDSIVRNMDIPKLYFRRIYGNSPFEYEIIDGQQRIRTIYEFHNNEFPLSAKYSGDELGGLYYQDLPEDVKDDIDLYQFNITVIDDADDEEIHDMFLRLQNGKPLNEAEKRNAIGGNMRDFISNLVKEHAVFKTFQKRNTRFSHEQMAAQCILLEMTGNIVDVRNSNLKKLYQNNRDFDPDGALAKRVVRIMNYMARTFGEPTPEFNGRSQFVSIYWLISTTLDTYTMSGYESHLRDFILDFELRRHQLKNSDIDFIRYSEALSRSSDGKERIEYRHKMLVREWLLFVPEIQLKDNQRYFSEAQRIAIYRRDDGICQLCGKQVSYDDFEADHIIPYTQGGPTTLENGQAAHKTCNASKGGR